jgi:hypothetical protein
VVLSFGCRVLRRGDGRLALQHASRLEIDATGSRVDWIWSGFGHAGGNVRCGERHLRDVPRKEWRLRVPIAMRSLLRPRRPVL